MTIKNHEYDRVPLTDLLDRDKNYGIGRLGKKVKDDIELISSKDEYSYLGNKGWFLLAAVDKPKKIIFWY